MGPRLANTSNPGRLVSHSLKAKSRLAPSAHPQTGWKTSGFGYAAGAPSPSSSHERLGKVLSAACQPPYGARLFKRKGTVSIPSLQSRITTALPPTPPKDCWLTDKVLQQQTQSLSNISVNGFSAAVSSTAQGVGVIWQIFPPGTLRKLKHYQMWSRILGAKRQIYPRKASLSL